MFYKRYTDSSNVPTWGGATYYFETDNVNKPIRQIEIYSNGNVLKYNTEHSMDSHSKLHSEPLFVDEADRNDWSNYEINEQEFQMAWQHNSTVSKKRSVIGYILGGISFIPLLGVPFGIAALIIGITKKQKVPVILGTLGVLVTVGLFGTLYYKGFVAKNAPFSKNQTNISLTKFAILTDETQIRTYKQQHGTLPLSLSDIPSSPTAPVIPNDNWGHPLIYQVIVQAQTYTLKSAGPDGVPNTADDVTAQLSN